jgi:hypothetical protein
MIRTTPTFRFPGQLPPPKAPDKAFVRLVMAATVLIVIGAGYVIVRSLGWLA